MGMDRDVFDKLASKELRQVIKENELKHNALGFSPAYAQYEIMNTLKGIGIDENQWHWKGDLRNPKWQAVKDELFAIFGLDIDKNYAENCRKLGVKLPSEVAF